MLSAQTRIVVLTGPKHSGKTTAVVELAQQASQQGFTVAGLLSPSIYQQNLLLGFNVRDIATGAETLLAQRTAKNTTEIGRFNFTEQGLQLGAHALGSPAARAADLVIVDEFGPLEMDHRGWRKPLDLLLTKTTGLITLVVRQDLAPQVADLYHPAYGAATLPAHPQSIDQIITLLKTRSTQNRSGL